MNEISKPKLPPLDKKREITEDEKEKEKVIPPILDKNRRMEVASESVKAIGTILISAIGIFSILVMKGIFDLAVFLAFMMLACKDTVTLLVGFLTGASADKLKIQHDREKKEWERKRDERREEWDEEKEKLRFMITEVNIENAKVRAELDSERKLKEEMLKTIRKV